MITSTANARIKQIRKLHDRKERKETGLFLAEGLKIVGAAVEQNVEIETIVYAPELLTSSFGRQLIDKQPVTGISLLEVSNDVFRSLALKEGPQGIAAVIHQKWESLDNLKFQDNACWVALDSVQDPGNLGTILRTQDAVGGQGIILLDHTTDPYDPTAVRASMGAVFSQKLVKSSFDEFWKWKKQSHYPLYGTSGYAQLDYHGVSYPSALILLMGSERMGLSDRHLELCDSVVKIPMVGRISDSLNLAIATAVVLYEIFNQQRGRKTKHDE